VSKLNGRYLASELVKADLKGSAPLIMDILFERDNTVLLGKEKAGKSIFAMQMACALSVGGKFLGAYDVPKAVDVVYIQAEGKLANTQSNLLNMTKVIDADLDRILWLYYPSIPFDTPTGYDEIITQIASWRRPEVIILDPLYMAMSGDLKDDVTSRKMIENLRKLADAFEATTVLVHHAHRQVRDQKGHDINEGDNAIFGSFVWKAYPDHVLMIEKVQGHKNYRRLSCNTQRMGNIVESLDLVLIEPTPLYFEKKPENHRPIDDLVLANISQDGTSIDQLKSRIDRNYDTVQAACRRLQTLGKIVRVNPNKYPVIYALEKRGVN